MQKIKATAKKNYQVRKLYHNLKYTKALLTVFKKNRQLKSQVSLKLPPERLIYLVAGTPDATWFYESGKQTANSIIMNLNRNNLEFSMFRTVLDFGCGCGRVVRHLQEKSTAVFYGTDYNKKLSGWCTKNLPGYYTTNGPTPPLQYSDGLFDFVYAWSVFTHFTEENHLLWLNELYRVLKPNGFLWFSYSGINFVQQLAEKEQQLFGENQIIVYDSSRCGSNWCCSYYSDEYLKKLVSKTSFRLVDLVPNSKKGEQSFCLLQKAPCGEILNQALSR